MITRLHEAGYVHAGMACYLCLKVEDVIDTGRSIEGEGVLAICTGCVHDMAMVAGMDPDAEAEVEVMAQLTSGLVAERDAAVKLTRKLRKDLRENKAALARADERAANIESIAQSLAEKVQRWEALQQDAVDG